MSRLLSSWSARTQVQRVELYTRGSLYVLFWFVLLVGLVNATAQIRSTAAVAALTLGTIVLGIAGTAMLRESMRLYDALAPVPWRHLVVLVALVGCSAVSGPRTAGEGTAARHPGGPHPPCLGRRHG